MDAVGQDQADLRGAVIDALTRQLGIDESQVAAGTTLADVGCSEFDLLSLPRAIQESTGIRLENYEVQGDNTVEELAAQLARRALGASSQSMAYPVAEQDPRSGTEGDDVVSAGRRAWLQEGGWHIPGQSLRGLRMSAIVQGDAEAHEWVNAAVDSEYGKRVVFTSSRRSRVMNRSFNSQADLRVG